MQFDRRKFLTAAGTSIACAAVVNSSKAAEINISNLRGGLNASDSGLRPSASDDQSRTLQKALDRAALENKPVFLPPGDYLVSNINLPSNTRLMGVPGASRLIYTGGGHFLLSENAAHLEITGITFDGANLPIQDYAAALVRINNADHAVIDNCEFSGSSQIGVEIDRSAGRITNSKISGAYGNAGIFALENRGMKISDNVIEDCANCGIMVYRWTRGEDNTIVSNNRVRRISAIKGGTGPWGNGINTYQCDGVVVSNNHVSDCAFSTIRSNSCSNIQIIGNTCFRAGETSIYSEFEFEGAMVANNIVDGGARGISIVNLDHGGRLSVCANNLIRNIKDSAPYEDKNHLFGNGISAEADISITGNVIERTATFGIMLGWGEYLRNVVASNNVIREADTGFYVSVVKGTGPVIISNNSLSRILRAGIRGYRWREPVTEDLALTGNADFKNLTVSGNRLA